VCGQPASDLKYTDEFRNNLHAASCHVTDDKTDVLASDFAGENKLHQADCSQSDTANSAALSFVQKYIGTDQTKMVDACGYRVCRLVHEGAGEAALAVMKQVCGTDSSGAPSLTETYFQLAGKPDGVQKLVLTIKGDPNAELPYHLVSPTMSMIAAKDNAARLKKDQTLLTYSVTVPRDLLQREGASFGAFYIQAGARIMRGAIEFKRTDEGYCKLRDAKGNCVKCFQQISWTKGEKEDSTFQCMGMRRNARVQASYSGILAVYGTPAEGDPNAFGQINLRQYDDTATNPYHMQGIVCPGKKCATDTGARGNKANAGASLISRVPKDGTMQIEIDVIQATGPSRQVQVDGVISIQELK
jgi:hypothetical protein